MRPLPDRFAPFVRWAALRCGLGEDEVPVIRMVELSLIKRFLPRAGGLYHHGNNEVWVLADADDHTVRAIVAHELAHAVEEARGWPPDEAFADGVMGSLLTRWYRGGATANRDPRADAMAAGAEARSMADEYRVRTGNGEVRHPRELDWIRHAHVFADRELERLGAGTAAGVA